MDFVVGRRITRSHRRGGLLILAAMLAAMTLAIATPAQAHEPYLAKAWGENRDGQLGNGEKEGAGLEKEGPEKCNDPNSVGTLIGCSSAPVEVSKLSGVTAIAGGGNNFGAHTLALLENGTVMAWGHNREGELGNGTKTASAVPVEVKGLKEVTAIAAGHTFSLALLKNGKVMAWGDNTSGQLGNGAKGESASSDVPVEVKELSGAVAIAAGASHSLAVLSNGMVVAWGNSGNGQLGNGTTTASEVPVAVCAVGATGPCPTGPFLEGVQTVAAAEFHSLAVLSNGTVVAWGDNVLGDLGNGNETKSFVPVKVKELKGVKAVSAGSYHSLALLENGTVMGWGENKEGQLGTGNSTGPETCTEFKLIACSLKPVQVSGLSNATAIAGGGHHSLALLADGTVWAWGENKLGELGNGSNAGPEPCGTGDPCSTTPVQVTKLIDAKGIGAGDTNSYAFFAPPPVVTGVTPNEGRKGGGTTVTITGAELEEPVAVKFGSANATNVKVSATGTVITAVSPAGTGTVDVSVTTPAGTSAHSSADEFFYSRPTVKKLSPRRGAEPGGTSVTITGTNFAGATAVRFGSTEATSFKVNSETSITAVSPAHKRGLVDVTVATTGGTSAISKKDRFKYI